MKGRLGFMQGRLSPLIDNKVQAFPIENWRQEFFDSKKTGLSIVEWTIDHDGLDKNPLMTASGRSEILHLAKKNALRIPSITGDCFMQAPFWKASNSVQGQLKKEFLDVVAASSSLGISFIVVPLVDNGSICSDAQEKGLVEFLLENMIFFLEHKVFILFESDYEPQQLTNFIASLPANVFGINYDTGNSAALGFCPSNELSLYGNRVLNVHIKDRFFCGETVQLGAGDASIKTAVRELLKAGYGGNFIFQTARASNDDHHGALMRAKLYLENVFFELQHV